MVRRLIPKVEHLPYPVVLSAAWSACLLLIAGGLVLLGKVVSQLLIVIIPLLVAVLLAAMLMPITNFLNRKVRWPRALASLATIFAVLGVIGGAVALLTTQLASGIPQMADSARNGGRELLNSLANSPFHVTSDRLEAAIAQAKESMGGSGKEVVSGAVEAGHTVVDSFAGLLICLIALFFFLHHGQKMWQFCLWFLPQAAREPTNQAMRRAWRSVSVYSHTQVLVALINATGVGVGALVLGVPFAFPMAFVVFLLSFIPIVGALISGVIPALVAFVDQGPVTALIMVIIVIVVHQCEAHILQPFLMGRAVALHPLVVIVVVAAATYIFGIAGALFAVPVVAAGNSAVRYLAGHDPFPDMGYREVSPHAEDEPDDHRDDREREQEATVAKPASDAPRNSTPEAGGKHAAAEH
ncbi:AI-2E family transporter [Corynebacterium heidelbergense]|uniref:AI-2E family transporter n=1 Tax=Corynebacterium heidelbergense TaxID=2055947 RepID=A0A364V3L3_9CORY|nr:AI-2E family transporter [Corynebacterium heidelbergense]RAV31235.1 AI-2E family transporter [Corynebacterium heidelbergense]